MVLEPLRRLDDTEAREWAKPRGIEGKDRGRAPAKLKAATEQ